MGTKRVIISQLFPTELGKEKRPEIEDEYKKQFQLIAKMQILFSRLANAPSISLDRPWEKQKIFFILNIFLQ